MSKKIVEELEVPETAPVTKVLDIASLKNDIYRQMGMRVFVPEQRFYLSTHWPELDRAIGVANLGIPYGKMYELSGEESGGKSLLQKLIYGEAQKDGAIVIHGDIEDSDDAPWNSKLGVDNDSLIVVKPKMVFAPTTPQQKKVNKEAKAVWAAQSAKYRKENPFVAPETTTEKRAQTAEEIFEEIELWIKKLHDAGAEKMVVGIDSIANLSTELQLEAGTHTNMRTNSDLSMFLSQNLKRWQIMAANYNVLVIFINQIREKPGVMFGDPQYEPGGRALRHNCQSRNRIRRIGNGRLYQAGKHVGINGILLNRKNKTGEGSLEGQGTEYKVLWTDKPLYDRVTFDRFVKKEKVAKDTDD
jgi:recombination protein RecA